MMLCTSFTPKEELLKFRLRREPSAQTSRNCAPWTSPIGCSDRIRRTKLRLDRRKVRASTPIPQQCLISLEEGQRLQASHFVSASQPLAAPQPTSETDSVHVARADACIARSCLPAGTHSCSLPAPTCPRRPLPFSPNAASGGGALCATRSRPSPPQSPASRPLGSYCILPFAPQCQTGAATCAEARARDAGTAP